MIPINRKIGTNGRSARHEQVGDDIERNVAVVIYLCILKRFFFDVRKLSDVVITLIQRGMECWISRAQLQKSVESLGRCQALLRTVPVADTAQFKGLDAEKQKGQK